MGIRGPGADVHRPNKDDETRVEPYDHMSQEAKDEWREVIGSFPPESFNGCDRPVIEAYINTLMTIRKLERQIIEDKEPLTVETATSVIENPIYKMLDARRRTLNTMAVRLRMVPSSRNNTYREPGKKGMRNKPEKPGTVSTLKPKRKLAGQSLL